MMVGLKINKKESEKMAKYKNYEYVGKNGKKDYRKTVLLDKNNEIINVSY